MEQEKKYTVYMLTSPDGKRYIGVTSRSLKRRWSNGKGYMPASRIRKAIDEIGWDSFEKEVIATGVGKEEAYDMERRLIIDYQTKDPSHGYNIADGGEYPSGWHASEERKRQISMQMRGRKLSPETREKLRQSNMRREVTEETREKMRRNNTGAGNPQYGKKRPDVSQILRERNLKNNPCVKVPVDQYSTDGVLINRWESAREASRETGVPATSITNCCKGRHKTSHGYVWKYADDKRVK